MAEVGGSEGYTFGSAGGGGAGGGALLKEEENDALTASTPRVAGFLAAVGLAGRTPKLEREQKGRFAMLEDEESEVWDGSLKSREGWMTFGADEEDGEQRQHEEMQGRGGVGVWDGYEFGSEGVGVGGTDSVQSRRSFLTSALGGFVPIASQSHEQEQEQGEEDHRFLGADAGLTPIHEEESDDGRSSTNDHHTARTTESAGTRSGTTHRTTSTEPTSSSSGGGGNLSSRYSGGSRRTPTRSGGINSTSSTAPSPSTSLYGSSFSLYSPTSTAPPPLTRSGSSAGHSSSDILKRTGSRSSWLWGRLVRSTSTSSSMIDLEQQQQQQQRIRDPTPAPRMDMITEGRPTSSSAFVDPFADPAELGLFSSSSRHHRSRRQDSSLSSSVSGAGTDVTTSSSVVLEERMRGMDVALQLTSRSRGESEVSGGVASEISAGEGQFGRLPSSEEEAMMTTAEARYSQLGAFPATGRLVSSRPPVPPPSMSHPLPAFSAATGVRAMVQRFEAASASPTTPPPRRAMSASQSMTSLPTPLSPTKQAGGSRRTTLGAEAVEGGAGAGQQSKFGLVRKPVLYVANPDEC